MAALLATALGAACSPTGAEVGRRTTVLLVASGDATEGSEANRALRRRLDERSDLELQSVARLAALAAEEDERADDDSAELEAQRRLAQAEDAFSRFDYAGATTQLGEALELLRPLATRATGRQRLAGIHLSLAEVLHVHGERDAALEEIRTCVHVDPECAPDPARHPPELIALFDEARASVSESSSTLSIRSEPPGARVTLDGRREGLTPVRWEAVPAGRHYVTLERDGFLRDVQVVSVAARTETERSFSLTEGPPSMRASAALRELQARGLDAEPRWRAEAADLTEADVLLVLRIDAEELGLAAYDGRGTPIAEPLAYHGDDGGRAREYLDHTLPEPVVPFYGQWWFWTPLSFGISIILAGATFVLVNEPAVRLVGGTVVGHD